ncbi:DDE-type integrase/transposase/recombinase [Pseudotabrizicola alkalilacus]|uniref:Transposase n=1 Tax=Pseudotabrizicola alkalilacus TaxID=2305252 RepID=A0A411Z0G9_9RHOB|nr:DDE-type integrase/transposase/recombinase [Pseudotabrizicola alkalilacus]RGP36556.1 transposase [Pseudotabrizicola alkalilacus]
MGPEPSSGNRACRYTDAERVLVRSVINRRLDEERCSITSILSSVHAVFKVHNENAARMNPPGQPLNTPGYDYIHATIDALAPIDHAIRTRGLSVAYRDMHGLGVGVEANRALARVEIDDYTFDLMVFLNAVGVWDWLRPGEREMLGLDGTARRVTMSAAIDVHTRCIVGMKISAGDTKSLLRDTVEMIFLDKAPIADAVGAHERWHMHGRPEMIVLDRGPNYITDETYDLLADLGITNLGAPAKKPWLRPFIERLFKTVHSGFAQRFSGRTFSNVVQRGENDAAARAFLTLDEFLQWLVRWILDIYHNTEHAGLLRRTPAEVWAQSQAVSQLQGVSREEMRRVFGIRRHRTLGPSGITMMHIRYQTDELARIFLAPPNRPKSLEVAWWPHDIGTISVKVAPDRWINVTAADPMWIGKSFDDLMMLRHSLAGERDRSDAVKARALAELDAAAYRSKALRGILPTIVTDKTYDHYEADFLRFMSTAERAFDAPEHVDLFDGIIDLSRADNTADSPPTLTLPAPASQSATATSAEDNDDLME